MATGPLGAARSDPPMTTGQAPPRRRAYRSPRRQQQAAETRAAVLAAAVQLFGERGWAATGMREVARAAGVSVETVYAGFGSKSDLLMAALDVAGVSVEQGMSLVAGRAPTGEERDGLWAVLAVEVYQLLTELSGWTPQQYETWVAAVIDRLLDKAPQQGAKGGGA